MIFNLFRNFFKKISFLLFVLINSFLFSCSNSINQENNMQGQFENPSIQTLANNNEEKYTENPVKNPVNNSGKKRGFCLGFFVITAVALAATLGITYVQDQNIIKDLKFNNEILGEETVIQAGQISTLEGQISTLNEAIYNNGNVVFTTSKGVTLEDCSSLYPNCQKCNEQACKVCNTGYSLDSNNACICNVSAMTSNGPNCATCLNPTTCTGCQSGYNLSNVYNACGTCTALPAMPNCKNCSNPANTCTECFVGSVQDIYGEAVC